MSDQNSQVGTLGKGNFTQMGNEFLEKLLEFNLTKNEHRLVLYFIRQLPGWKACYRPFSNDQLTSATSLPKPKLWSALRGLIKKGVLVKNKAQGLKSPLYGFNEKTFERIVIGESISVWEENAKVIDLVTFKVIKSATLKVPQSDTFRNQRAATTTGLGASKYTSQIKLNIISPDLRCFLDAQPRATKARWERLVYETLGKYPEDQGKLWAAIDRVTRTKKDFFGKPIERSIIGLFEGTEWVLVREALMTILKVERDAEDKRRKAEDDRRILDEQRDKSYQTSVEIDPSKISPLFRKYAEKGKNS